MTFTLHIHHDATASATEAYDLLTNVMDPELTNLITFTLVSGPIWITPTVDPPTLTSIAPRTTWDSIHAGGGSGKCEQSD